ncbi:MAG: 4Fe-4S dicluster domain-containing protein [Deltaproteobacteria bacterium]|nr:4Fe-4S dicluster domain-containing protein [Deltaproteobacteria bacterium]
MEKETASGESENTSASAHHGHAEESFRSEVRQAIGLNPAKCYQCGKCSAGCPMASEMTLMPHEMIRLVQLDRRDRLMQDESMWLCLTCETCTARCPNGFDPARMLDGLREMSLRAHGENAPRRIQAFHSSFLDQIRSHGRVFEFGLVFAYKMRSGALFDDVLNAPGMYFRGKLKLTPHTIDGVDDVRRIFDACMAEEER